MIIAIDKSNQGFHKRWKSWLKKKGVDLVEIDIHAEKALSEVKKADGLMWHHWQTNTKDLIKAKRLLFALEHGNFPVYPDFNSNWHFDDKIGQMYLLQALDLPLVSSHHFVSRDEALAWLAKQEYPIIFKLARGAGSANVQMVHSQEQGKRIVNKAFSRGFLVFDGFSVLEERFSKFRKGNENITGLLKGIYHLFSPPLYSRYLGRSLAEVYFQEFIPNEGFDIRIIVIRDKAFALKRLTRDDDFRASGSGKIEYDKSNFEEEWIKLAFQWAKRLDTQIVAFDVVIHEITKKPFIVEISYGYAIDAYDSCTGYWDDEMNYYPGTFDSCEWMVDDFIKSIRQN